MKVKLLAFQFVNTGKIVCTFCCVLLNNSITAVELNIDLKLDFCHTMSIGIVTLHLQHFPTLVNEKESDVTFMMHVMNKY